MSPAAAKKKRPSLPAARSLAQFSLAMGARYGEERIADELPAVIVPTGSAGLDKALRVGGWQLGRVYEIVGPPDSGKTTLMIASMVSFRRMFPDRAVCYINMEGTFSARRALAMGLDCSKEAKAAGTWLPLLPEHSEDVSDMARDVVQSGFASVVVVDSIGAMESKKVLFERDAEEDTMGKNAGIITKMNKALATLARMKQCTVLLVNQPRANYSGYGGDISAGPKHMRHVTTAKVDMSGRGGEEDVRKIKYADDESPTVISHAVVARVTRAKNAVSGGSAKFYVNKEETDDFGPAGIDWADEYLTLGHRAGAVKIGGAWYTFPDGTKANGKIAAGRHLREHPETLEAVRASLGFEAPLPELPEGDDELCRQHRPPQRWAACTRSTWPGSTPGASPRRAGASGPTRETAATATTPRSRSPGMGSPPRARASPSPWR